MGSLKIARALMAGAAAVALSGVVDTWSATGPRFVSAAHAANVQISFFFNRLDRHGTWVAHPRYGYVFVPAVRAGWRPYTVGHWVYTDDYGWYWVSDEPFAWAVYHYGRWFYDPVYGWCWVPGNVWAPAWVTWRHGGGHVGWAPIGPHQAGYVYGTPEYYEPAVVEAWVFVPERRFVAVDLARYVAPVVEINIFLGRARDRDHVHYRDGRVRNAFLPRDRVRQFTKTEINVYNIKTVDDPAQASKVSAKGKEKSIQTFQAQIAETEPKEKPKKIATRPEQVKSKPKLKETATKGEKPEGAPPSAAELKPGGTVEGQVTTEGSARPGGADAKAGAETKTDADAKAGPAGADIKVNADGKVDADAKAKANADKPGQPKAKQDSPDKPAPDARKQAAPPAAPRDTPAAPKPPAAPRPPQAQAPEAPKPPASPQPQATPPQPASPQAAPRPPAAPQATPPQGRGPGPQGAAPAAPTPPQVKAPAAPQPPQAQAPQAEVPAAAQPPQDTPQVGSQGNGGGRGGPPEGRGPRGERPN